MHSITTASGFSLAKKRINLICSPIEAERSLWMILSLPSASIIRGAVPVVLAKVRKPPALKPAAMSRVTLDFPRVPFTWIRNGIAAIIRLWLDAST